MKHLLAAVLVSVSLVADAQPASQAPTIKAPVNVATHLFQGCIQAQLMANTQIEPTRVGINKFVEQADEFCLIWTMIWFKPLIGMELSELQPDAMTRLSKNRLAILQELTNLLRKDAMIK